MILKGSEGLEFVANKSCIMGKGSGDTLGFLP